MIYLDSSVALAHLLAEDRFPPDELWEGQLVSGFLSARSGIVLTRTVCRIRMAVRNLIGRVALLVAAPPSPAIEHRVVQETHGVKIVEFIQAAAVSTPRDDDGQ
jgi:hypothetical protein